MCIDKLSAGEYNEAMEENENRNYISLADAAKLCSYSEHYLRLRSRQGKLKSIKLGKKWMTTRAWLDDYQRQVGDWRAAAEKKKAAGGKAAPPPELAEVIFSRKPPAPLPPFYRAGFLRRKNRDEIAFGKRQGLSSGKAWFLRRGAGKDKKCSAQNNGNDLDDRPHRIGQNHYALFNG